MFPDGSSKELPRDEALAAARTADLDLVEIHAASSPPVAKLMDFKR